MLHQLLKSPILVTIALMVLIGLSHNAIAHKYFFAISEMTLNNESESIEVIHQLTAHDIENAIADIKQEHFSPEHKNYELYLKSYVEKHFFVEYQKQVLPLNWVGIELNKGKIFVYQEIKNQSFLKGLVVKNHLLVDTYPKQINTVNYLGKEVKGSLTFSRKSTIATIKGNKT